jgi:hypothetical protein
MDPEARDLLFNTWQAAGEAASCLFAALGILREDGYEDELITEFERHEETLRAIERRIEDIEAKQAA